MDQQRTRRRQPLRHEDGGVGPSRTLAAIIIRPANPEDAQAAAEVLRRSIAELCEADHRGDAETLRLWLANKTPAHVLGWISSPANHLIVAEENGRILGVASMQASGRIGLNYVSPDARLRGVSKALVTALEAHARASALTACELESTRTALAFYRGMGYIQRGEPRPGFGVTLSFPMWKSLAAGA